MKRRRRSKEGEREQGRRKAIRKKRGRKRFGRREGASLTDEERATEPSQVGKRGKVSSFSVLSYCGTSVINPVEDDQQDHDSEETDYGAYYLAQAPISEDKKRAPGPSRPRKRRKDESTNSKLQLQLEQMSLYQLISEEQSMRRRVMDIAAIVYPQNRTKKLTLMLDLQELADGFWRSFTTALFDVPEASESKRAEKPIPGDQMTKTATEESQPKNRRNVQHESKDFTLMPLIQAVEEADSMTEQVNEMASQIVAVLYSPHNTKSVALLLTLKDLAGRFSESFSQIIFDMHKR